MKQDVQVFVFIIIEVLGILEAVGKILEPNSFTDKVCVFLIIAPTFELAIFRKKVISFLTLLLARFENGIFWMPFIIQNSIFSPIFVPKKGVRLVSKYGYYSTVYGIHTYPGSEQQRRWSD